MVCRSNPASSVVIALARNATWLDDAQVQSIFHRLRHDHDPTNQPGESREQMVDRVFTRAGNQITRDPALRPQRRGGLLNRLDASRIQTDGLGDDTLLAMVRLQAGVQAAQLATEGRLTELAGRRGMSLREARAEFIQLRSEAPSGRQPRATAPELRDLGIIPSDPATRYALAEMAARPPVMPPVRLVDQWLTVTGGGGVTHVGIGARSTRVEFRHDDGTVSAVVSVDAADQDALDRASGVGQLPGEVASRLRRENQPVEAGRVEATGYAPRCDECGQFVGNRFHECRARAARVASVEPVTVNRGGAELSIAPAAAVRQAVQTRNGPVVLGQVDYSIPDAVVMGRVAALRTVTQRTAMLVGGPLAGWLIYLSGPAAAFGGSAVLFAVSVAALALVNILPDVAAGRSASRPGRRGQAAATAAAATLPRRASTSVQPPTGRAGRASAARRSTSWWTSSVAGLRAVRRDSVLPWLLLLIAGMNFGFAGPVTAGIPLLSAGDHWGAQGAGLLLGGFGLGAAVSGLSLVFVRRIPHAGWLVLAGVFTMGAALAAVGVAATLPAALVAVVVLGLASGVFGTVVHAMLLTSTPKAELGRAEPVNLVGSCGCENQ